MRTSDVLMDGSDLSTPKSHAPPTLGVTSSVKEGAVPPDPTRSVPTCAQKNNIPS